jgi:hypothetical protein
MKGAHAFAYKQWLGQFMEERMPNGKYHSTVTVPTDWDVVALNFDPGDEETAATGASREIWLTIDQARDMVRLVNDAIAKIERRAVANLRIPPGHHQP